MPIEMCPPTKFPALKVGQPNFPANLDGTNGSRGSYRPRSGNSNGIQKKKNKGGKRMECSHGPTGHGPCGCKN